MITNDRPIYSLPVDAPQTLGESGNLSCIRKVINVIMAPFYFIASAFSNLLYWTFNWGAKEVAIKKPSQPGLPPKTQYQELKLLHQPIDNSLFNFARLQVGRNRFSDILPNEPTRVKLNLPEFYFNANRVLETKAIASQGPMDNEISDFWHMVWHGEVDTIVMLANPVENGRDKCSEYWKEIPEHNSNATVAMKTLSEATLFENDGVKIVERKIKMTRGSDEKTVTQFHLQNWPDFGVVSPDVLATLVKLVSANVGNGRLLAHCSAGVGRTGTFLTTFQAYLEKTKEVFGIAADLRDPQKGRVGMIQTPEQYELACQTASLLLENSKH